MASMFGPIVLALLGIILPLTVSTQALGVLHIRIVMADADGQPAPVPRHALLVSDNPQSTAPRRVLTGLDGTADLRLRPGNYTVESDAPVLLAGKAYEWRQDVDIVAGRNAVLEFNGDNAQAADATAADGAAETDPIFVLNPRRESVFGVWTPTAPASGFLISATGLVLTQQKAVGNAASIEVQLSPTLKVAGTVVASDAEHDVAIVLIDPAAVAALRPIAPTCADSTSVPVTQGQKIFAISAPFRQVKGVERGTVRSVSTTAIGSDFRLARGGAGGPVLDERGHLIGVTSLIDTDSHAPREDLRVIPIRYACEMIASPEKNEKKMTALAPPRGTPLPLEPTRPFPVAALQKAAERRAGSLSPYQLASSGFEIGFITPVMTYGAQYQSELIRKRSRSSRTGPPDAAMMSAPPVMDFANWSDYVADFPPVLLIRVTPKMAEGFWTTVGRLAARTQGVALPPIKRFKSGFLRLRAFCGSAEVIPIHPFKLERRLSDSEAIYEGLYVFDPDSLGPACGTVRLELYSDKDPAKADEVAIDPKVLDQIRHDFEPFFSATSAR